MANIWTRFNTPTSFFTSFIRFLSFQFISNKWPFFEINMFNMFHLAFISPRVPCWKTLLRSFEHNMSMRMFQFNFCMVAAIFGLFFRGTIKKFEDCMVIKLDECDQPKSQRLSSLLLQFRWRFCKNDIVRRHVIAPSCKFYLNIVLKTCKGSKVSTA